MNTVSFFRTLRSRVLFFVVAAVMAVVALPSNAQFNASLSGTVQDPSGAIVPGASVVLTNVGSQKVLTITTGSDGSYHFNELPPAHYKLVVTAAGFKATTFEDISLDGQAPRNVDVKLATGGNTETVTVNSDDVSTLQTGDADVRRTISSEEIQRLPIFGGDPYELLRTAPGITGDGARGGTGGAVFLPNSVGPGGSNSGIYQTENQIQISADGQRVADNNYTIDGVSVNSLGRGGAAVVTPNQESVQSITVISTSYDAGDGRNTGAQIKTTTKSGTNDLHGSLYFLYNEPGLNAYNRYGGPAGQKPSKVAIKSRTYAASLGGPIVKNKLFLFGSFQGYGSANNTTSTEYVDTAAFRSMVIMQRPGGLSAGTLADPNSVPRIRNLVTSDCSGYANNQGRYVPTQVNGAGPVVTQTAQSGPYCQVVTGGIDVGSVTAGGASQLGNYLSYFTSTTQSGAPGPSTVVGGGFVGGGLDGVPDLTQAQLIVPSHSRGNQFNGRLDYNVTQKDLVAGSVYFTKLDNYTSTDTTSRVLGDIPFKPLNSAATAIWVHTFSPTWLNEFRANGTRFRDDGARDFGNINLGIPYTYVEDLPYNNIDYGVTTGNTTGSELAQNTIEVGDKVSHTFGSHVLTAGGGIRWEQDNNNLDGSNRPDFSFRGLWNLANDAAFFESQVVNPNTGLAAQTQRYYRSQTYYGFVQHDWKVTPTFSFNAGFRYEIYTPYHNKTGPTYEPVLGPPGHELTALVLKPTNNLYNTDYGHFAPKVAFAWNPDMFQNKVVVRGGGAIAYNHLDVSLFENALSNGPGIASFTPCCGTSTADFSTPRDGGVILYEKGTSNSPNSYPVNPAFATGTNAAGFPNDLGGAPAPQIGVYGVATKIKNPMSYLYSLETETLMPYQMTLTVGYAGSTGHHYARLVNQPFLFATNVGGVNTPVNSDFQANTDSNQAYNALNVRVQKKPVKGVQFDATYTWSKSIDQVSNGDFSDGSANQTNPANNKTERGPSDYDVRNRFVGTVLYTSPQTHTGHRVLDAVASGYQATSIVTLHSGFSWTPVTNNGVAFIPGSNTVSPIRPIAYAAGSGPSLIGNSCSNGALQTGSNFSRRGTGGTAGGTSYFSTAQPSANVPYIPIIGRNSLTGPCYRDVDFSVAKQVSFEGLGHGAVMRFQANMYNAFNLVQLQPITNEGAGTNIQDTNFGKSPGADAGRVIEFLLRVNF
jgi:Carboxypeptidase regulatory-like domain